MHFKHTFKAMLSSSGIFIITIWLLKIQNNYSMYLNYLIITKHSTQQSTGCFLFNVRRAIFSYSHHILSKFSYFTCKNLLTQQNSLLCEFFNYKIIITYLLYDFFISHKICLKIHSGYFSGWIKLNLIYNVLE